MNALQGLSQSPAAPRFTLDARVRQLVDEYNRDGISYHKIDLGNGLTIRGEYDMARYVHHYEIPADLTGKTVLDIGTSSGYFAFECARRGGHGDYWTYWAVNAAGLQRMLLSAGFRKVHTPASFTLKSESGMRDFVVPHVVVKAEV